VSLADRQATIVATCAAVTRIFPSAKGEVPALRGIDLQVTTGLLTGIVGPSGSGKTTLLRLLAATDRPTSGEVTVAGTRVDGASDRRLRRLRRDHVGIVRQRPSDNLLPWLDAAEHVRRAAALRRVRSIDVGAQLAAVGLAGLERRRPVELSGGEQQRLAVAAALTGGPRVVVADEPTSELDREASDVVVALLRAVASRHTAVVVATHDAAVWERCDRVLHLHYGALSGESHSGGEIMASIDAAGRLQLPPESWPWFPDGRAVLRLGEREIHITPPEERP
jgi:putative ABC transport system ATP-binding protein